MEKGTEAVVHWLITCGEVKEEERELYRYAVESFLLFLSPLLLAAVYGLCLGCIKQSIVMIIPFMAIRKFSGGYHAKHLWVCLLCSSLLLLLCSVFLLVLDCDWKLFMVTIFSGISLAICSPLDNENRVLDSEEKNCYKKITVIFTTGFLFLGILLHFLGLHRYTICIFTGIILSAGLQMPVILKRRLWPDCRRNQ